MTDKASLETERFDRLPGVLDRGRVNWDTDLTNGTDFNRPPLRPDSALLLLELVFADFDMDRSNLLFWKSVSSELIEASASPYWIPASQISAIILSASLYVDNIISL